MCWNSKRHRTRKVLAYGIYSLEIWLLIILRFFFHSLSNDLSVSKKATLDVKYFLIKYKAHLGKVVNML